jgi:hypothetical protein
VNSSASPGVAGRHLFAHSDCLFYSGRKCYYIITNAYKFEQPFPITPIANVLRVTDHLELEENDLRQRPFPFGLVYWVLLFSYLEGSIDFLPLLYFHFHIFDSPAKVV